MKNNLSSPGGAGPDARVRRYFAKDLLAWFAANQRVLPWRTHRTPYRVWISELMLQQTRVDQALPYYRRFMKRFPSLVSLARAPREDVMKHWEGLGYYRRARVAHETARHLVREHGGRFPRTLEGLLALPGIGPYTGAAIASLALGLDHAVIDGNVVRVASRVFAWSGDISRRTDRAHMELVLARLLPVGQAAAFNEAMMELGALVCTPAKPSCGACPLAAVCRARIEGRPEKYPFRRTKKAIPHRHVGAGVVVDGQGRVLMARRREGAMLGGLWEFPGGGVEEGEAIPECIRRELLEELGIEVRVGPHLATVRHTFSHFRMDLHAHWARIDTGRPRAIACDAFKWVPVKEVSRLALPVADQKIHRVLIEHGAWPEF